jgi:DNA polymerase III subunit gamma/tau
MFNWIAKEEGADAADPEKAGAMAPEPMAPPAEAGRWHRADGTGPMAPEPMAPGPMAPEPMAPGPMAPEPDGVDRKPTPTTSVHNLLISRLSV